MLPQINFIASILTPNDFYLKSLSDIMEKFVTKGLNFSKKRYYISPEEGGLGMFDLGNFITALQCTWIRMAQIKNDNWKNTISALGNGNPVNAKVENFNSIGTGIRNIVSSLVKFRNSFFCFKNNFMLDNVFNNDRYSINGRKFDDEFFGLDNVIRHRQSINELTWKKLTVYNVFVEYGELEHVLGFNLPRLKYFQLKSTYQKLSKKMSEPDSEPLKLDDLFRYTKKGSKAFRKILDYNKIGPNYYQSLTQCKTYFKTTDTVFLNREICKHNLASWNTHGFPNRLRVFLLKFYNNILGTGNRVVHIDPSKDPSCIFCSTNKNLPAPIESFSHIFYDCPSVSKIIEKFCENFFEPEINRQNYFENSFIPDLKKNFAIVTVINILRYSIWQLKLQKSPLSYYTVEVETISLLETITECNKKIKNAIINCEYIYLEGDGQQRRQHRP